MSRVRDGAAPPPRAGQRPSRAGKKALGAHFPAELGRAVKLMAAEEDTSASALLGEAIALLLCARACAVRGTVDVSTRIRLEASCTLSHTS